MGVGGLILAAGRSTRMGRSKALLEVDGRSFLATIAARLRFAGFAPVGVVAAAGDHAVAEAAGRAGARLVYNPDPQGEMLSSLLCGLDLLEPSGIEALLVWPVDHPAVGEATVMALKLAWENARPPVVLAEHKGQRGHPVLFSRAVFDELRKAPPGEGARAVVRAHEADLLRLSTTDRGVLDDLDTPAELERFLRRSGQDPDQARE